MRAMIKKLQLELGAVTPVLAIAAVIYLAIRLGVSFAVTTLPYEGSLPELTYMAFLLTGTISISSYSRDIENKFILTAVTMPVKRSTYIMSFYLFALIVALETSLAETLTTVLSCLGNETFSLETLISRLLVGSAVCLSPSVAIIPFVTALINKDKSFRVLSGALMGGFLGGTVSVIISRSDALPSPGKALAAMLIVLVLTGLSCLLSVRLFSRKELTM